MEEGRIAHRGYVYRAFVPCCLTDLFIAYEHVSLRLAGTCCRDLGDLKLAM